MAVKAAVEKNFRRAKVRPGSRRSSWGAWLTWRAGRWAVASLLVTYAGRNVEPAPEGEFTTLAVTAPSLANLQVSGLTANAMLKPSISVSSIHCSSWSATEAGDPAINGPMPPMETCSATSRTVQRRSGSARVMFSIAVRPASLVTCSTI